MADFDVIVVGRGTGNTDAAMRHDLSVDDVAGTIHAHPTVSKVLKAAFREVTPQ